MSLQRARPLSEGRFVTLFTGDSNRQLAERMGLSHDFITRVRRELEATGVIARTEKVVGKDGCVSPASVITVEHTAEDAESLSSDDKDSDTGQSLADLEMIDENAVSAIRELAKKSADHRDYEDAARLSREADEFEDRISANDGNPVPVDADPNDPTENRGDAGEDDDELEAEEPPPMDDTLPQPAFDASKPRVPWPRPLRRPRGWRRSR